MGINATVHAEIEELPKVMFQIKTIQAKT